VSVVLLTDERFKCMRPAVFGIDIDTFLIDINKENNVMTLDAGIMVF